jgi:chitin synthase
MMVKAFGKRWGNHSSFKVGSVHRSGFPTFTINHFNGPVTYSAEGFLNRNLDSLSPDFVSLLRGNTTGYKATAGGEVLIPSIRLSTDCFWAKQLQRRFIHVMSYTS